MPWRDCMGDVDWRVALDPDDWKQILQDSTGTRVHRADLICQCDSHRGIFGRTGQHDASGEFGGDGRWRSGTNLQGSLGCRRADCDGVVYDNSGRSYIGGIICACSEKLVLIIEFF